MYSRCKRKTNVNEWEILNQLQGNDAIEGQLASFGFLLLGEDENNRESERLKRSKVLKKMYKIWGGL